MLSCVLSPSEATSTFYSPHRKVWLPLKPRKRGREIGPIPALSAAFSHRPSSPSPPPFAISTALNIVPPVVAAADAFVALITIIIIIITSSDFHLDLESGGEINRN